MVFPKNFLKTDLTFDIDITGGALSPFIYQPVAIGPLYHWSPPNARFGIVRRGLVPKCPTATTSLPKHSQKGKGHFEEEEGLKLFDAVCLGTSPFHAWALSGDISAKRGEVWDLWEVRLEDDDMVFPMSTMGPALDEIRVANRIPKSRVLWVAERKITRTFTNPVSRANLMKGV